MTAKPSGKIILKLRLSRVIIIKIDFLLNLFGWVKCLLVNFFKGFCVW